jgi:flagellar M-ring protein FliF
MDNAVAQNKPIPLVPAQDGLVTRFAALPGRTRWFAVAGLAGLMALLVALSLGVRDNDYRVLFPNLSEKDGGQIIDKLTQMNVPYRFAEGGGSILVPASRVHELRMKLTASGLPSAGSTGYELLDKSTFGQTQGQERMNVQRAIEGELTRTIQSLASVQTARVHLALPNQNGFFREQQKPSASVVLTLHPGRSLERSQIAGIVHLVSSSVPELNAKAVSVIDGTGTLLSGQAEVDPTQGLDSQQLQFRRDVEASHMKRVLALLEPVVGPNNVRASVAAEIDFSQSMSTAEEYRPNQGTNAQITVREQRTEDSTQPGSATPAGVPGATSNQPPTPATAPINGAAQPLQAAGGGSAQGAQRREAATRFEVDKTVTVTRKSVGTVKRLNAAVVVNHRVATDAKGKSTSTPLSEKELEQLTALVQQGIGFNAERGDAVRVINAPFRVEATPGAEATPLWQQPWLQDMLRSAAAPAALALVALVVVFALVRPTLAAIIKTQPPGSRIDEVVDGDNALPAPTPSAPPLLEAPGARERLEAARAMAKQNPAAVANILRGWVNGEG